jgi:lipopolysaccharide export system permease protein
MPRIIDRYILLEVSKVLGAVVGVLLLITLSLLFLRTLEEVNVGALNTNLVLRFLGFQILRDLASLLPPAFFLAVLVALGRLARDSELIAIAASGMGPGRIYRALANVVLPLVLLTAWFALDLQPWAAAQIQRIRVQQSEQVSQIAGLQAGRFYQQDDGRVTVFVGQIDGDQQLRNLFIHDVRGSARRIVLSDTGLHRLDPVTGDHEVTLLDGRRYDGTPGAADYAIGRFQRYRLRIPAKDPGNQASRKRSTIPTRELWGSEGLADRAELEHRLSGPVAIFSLALIAVPLSATSPRQRSTGRMVLAFLTYFGFFNLQRVAEGWMEGGITPTWLGSLWYQGLILLVVYLVLLSDSYWYRRLMRRLFPMPVMSAPVAGPGPEG